jgi:hypothetical protein
MVNRVFWAAVIILALGGPVLLGIFEPANAGPWMLGLILGLFAVSLAREFLGRPYRFRQRRLRFAGREILSEDEIISRFYAQENYPKGAVLREWHAVARAIGVDAGKLRPTDRFAEELALPGWRLDLGETDDGLESLAIEASRRLRSAQSTISLSELETLDKFVRCMVAISDTESRG